MCCSQIRFALCSATPNQTLHSQRVHKIMIAVSIICAVGGLLALTLAFSGILTQQLTHIAKISGSVTLAFSVIPFCCGARKQLPPPRSYALHSSSNYISIKVEENDVQNYPIPHLRKFVEEIKKQNQYLTYPGLNVEFLGQRGVDAGGLRRSYIDSLFIGVMANSGINFATSSTGLAYPLIGENEPNQNFKRNVCRDIGTVMTYCYSNESERNLPIGQHFDAFIFSAATSFSSTEINTSFADLSLETKVRIAHALNFSLSLEMHAANPRSPEPVPHEQLVELLSKQLNDTIDEWTFQVVEEAYNLSSDTYMNLPDSLEEKSVQEIYESPELKTQLRDALADQFKEYFDPRLRAIHAIAEGMKAGCLKGTQNRQMYTNDTYWDHQFLRNQNEDYLTFKTALQGTMDRELIAHNIRNAYDLATEGGALQTKIRWLKEWITGDGEISLSEGVPQKASEIELKQFIKFVTGSSALPPTRIMKIFPSGSSPVPTAHTCSHSLDIAREFVGEEDGINDRTKDAFLAIIKAVITGEGFSIG